MSYSHLAADVRHLLRQMGMERVSFMGQTMGGRVGMILALTQPKLFDKLICVDSTPRQVSPILLNGSKIIKYYTFLMAIYYSIACLSKCVHM